MRDDEDQRLRADLELHKEELESQNEQLLATNAALQRANQALELARDDYRTLFELGPLPCLTIDQACQVQQANAPAMQLFGLAAASLGAARLDAFVAPANLPVFRRFVEQVTTTGRSSSDELVLVLGDDELAVLLQGVAMPAAASRGLRLLCTVFDLTVRKRAESRRSELDRRLQHVQKLESLRVLAGGVAHDFNNLLAVIGGNLELALTQLEGTTPIRPQLEDALDGARHAATLSRQMLAFCGQGRFVTEPIDVSVLVRELLPLIRTTAKTTTVELDAGVDSAIVDGDSAQLRQAVLNLVTNASEAAATTVRVSLALRDLSVDEIYTCELDATMPPGRYVALTIDDNGSGIGADTRPRVFDPFFSTKFSGRGLGLAVVQGIARTHRGDVSIQSQVGAGTTFTVFLPIATRTPLVDESVAARNDLVGLRILVIEDDEAVARTLMRICKAAKMVGTHARSGEEAVALVEHQTFDLALVDLVMPGMGGAACGAQLRQLRPDLPLVLMTGFGQVPAETATIFETVIGKPYGRTDLLALIARLARRG